MQQIVVIGGNIAGLTTALELKRRLGHSCKVIMISKLPYFIFQPSLIWIPFRQRELEDIVIPLERITSKARIELINAEATQILPREQIVKCPNKEFFYDYLIIATGPKWLTDQVEGMGPNRNVSYIFDMENALITRERLSHFYKNPGPVVIGAAQGIQCLGAAYEFLFLFEKQCRHQGIRNQVDITFITPEPYVGHLGMGGINGSHYFLTHIMRRKKINYIINAEIRKVTNETIILKTAQSLPYRFSMLMPMFHGADMIRNSPGLGDHDAFVPVNESYQHLTYQNIFAVGSAANSPSGFDTPVSLGIAKTGYASIASAKAVAENIIRLSNGKKDLSAKPVTKLPELCVMDLGCRDFYTLTLPLLSPRLLSLALLNPWSNFGKVTVEKYLLWKFRHGYSRLPP